MDLLFMVQIVSGQSGIETGKSPRSNYTTSTFHLRDQRARGPEYPASLFEKPPLANVDYRHVFLEAHLAVLAAISSYMPDKFSFTKKISVVQLTR
jgi:hypothetical protein